MTESQHNAESATAVEWVQVKPHGPYGGPEGWIPRPVLEGMGINCSPLDRQIDGIRGKQQGTVWFTAEQSKAIHQHPKYHAGPLDDAPHIDGKETQ